MVVENRRRQRRSRANSIPVLVVVVNVTARFRVLKSLWKFELHCGSRAAFVQYLQVGEARGRMSGGMTVVVSLHFLDQKEMQLYRQ